MMKNCMRIYLKKDKILIKISEEATQQEILECMKSKIEKLSKMYKEEKTPICVTGKILKRQEMKKIEELITKEIQVDVEFDNNNEMGLAMIKKAYEKDLQKSETQYYKVSLRGGQKIEFEGSVVIIGDVNGGAEVIAGGNIIVLGTLRGLAHAGAKGNKKAIVAAGTIDAPQIRIANLVKEIEKEEYQPKKCRYVYVKEKEIIIE